MNEQEIYVDNDLLGQQILFRSATGERLGFFNSRIVSMLEFRRGQAKYTNGSQKL